MTDTTITVHGFDFSVTGDGFRYARDDFDKIANCIERGLADLSFYSLRQLHTGARFDEGTGEPVSRVAAASLERLAVRQADYVLRKWADRSNVYVSVYPV